MDKNKPTTKQISSKEYSDFTSSETVKNPSKGTVTSHSDQISAFVIILSMKFKKFKEIWYNCNEFTQNHLDRIDWDLKV
jgi:hypothetical protein